MYEKVSPGHPDKIADRIAGALVDYAYNQEPDPKIAVEVLIGHGECHIIAETSVVIPPKFVEDAARRIAKYPDLMVDYKEVPQDSHLAGNQEGEIRCGDNGIFKGVPVTDEQVELTRIVKGLYKELPYDSKFILDGHKLIACQSNAKEETVREFLTKEGYASATINPLGDWTGGIDVDTGCVEENELVATVDGLKKIKDVKVGDIAYTQNGKHKVEAVIDKGVKDVLRITTKRGHDITVTPDHPMLTLTKDGLEYKEAGKLQFGDLVVRKNSYPQEKPHKVKRVFKYGRGAGKALELNTEYRGHAYLLGYMVGDGWYNEDTGTVFFSVGSEEESASISKVIFDNWGIEATSYVSELKTENGNVGYDRKVCFCSKTFCQVLSDLGFNKGARNKSVPECILQANNTAKSAFLSGLFDADGCCRGSKSGRNCGKETLSISLVSVSERLIRDVSVLLGSMGIQTTISRRAATNKICHCKCGQEIIQKNDAYALHIPGEKSKKQFMKRIGFSLSSKHKWATGFRDREFEYEDHRSYPRYAIKTLVNKDVDLCYRYGLEKYGDASADRHMASYCKYTHILNVYGKYSESAEYRYAQSLLNFDIEEVKEVVDVGKAHVYDLTIEEDHSFVASGFIVHNCTNRKLGSDMADSVTGGGLSGKDCSKADVSVNIYCFLMAQKFKMPYEVCCAIGDTSVNGVPYADIVRIAKKYIRSVGGFEKFAEWGLIR